MEKVSSVDGTTIAFDRLGEGAPLVLVGGTITDRSVTGSFAEALAESFTVLNFDRRGRGDSGDTLPFDVQREIEDIGALVEVADGPPVLYGHSSGAALVLRAAAQGLHVRAVVLHDAPFTPDVDSQRARDYDDQLQSLLADGRRGEALDLFMALTGMPQAGIEAARSSPGRAGLEGIAHTIAYDSAALGNADRGGTLPVELLELVNAPLLTLSGAASPPFMQDNGARIAAGVAHGQHRVLEGQGHNADPTMVAAAIAEFLRNVAR